MNRSDYIEQIHWPIARRRTCVEVSDGEVTEFYVQLEMNLSPELTSPDDWVDIACFDHQPNRERGHDIRKEGLHLDIYHPNGPDRMITSFTAVAVDHAPRFCEKYFDKNYEKLCLRYADWARATEIAKILTPL